MPSISSLHAHCAVVLIGLGASATCLHAQDAPAAREPAIVGDSKLSASADAPADDEWQVIAEAPISSAPPGSEEGKEPVEEEVQAWIKSEAARLMALADRARAFSTQHPKHPSSAEARRKEREALLAAARFGNESAQRRLAEADVARLAAPDVTPEERFEIRSRQIFQRAQATWDKGPQAARDELEKGARELLQEFPDKPEVFGILLEAASDDEGDERSRAIAAEVLASNAPDEVKARAQGVLRKMDAVGKSLTMRFTAIDGREVDLAKLRGKVVLIDFWATWCGPCVAEIPNVKATYEKLHKKGFEIIGISFDSDEAKLVEFVKKKELPWPQYFDGKGWQNQFGQEYAINGIPTMWLVDKKGVLRDPNARGDLESKVEKLLAESSQ